jgi:hypothetical protein
VYIFPLYYLLINREKLWDVGYRRNLNKKSYYISKQFKIKKRGEKDEKKKERRKRCGW